MNYMLSLRAALNWVKGVCTLYSMTSNEVVIMGRHTVHLMVCSYWIFPPDEIYVRMSLENVLLGIR